MKIQRKKKEEEEEEEEKEGKEEEEEEEEDKNQKIKQELTAEKVDRDKMQREREMGLVYDNMNINCSSFLFTHTLKHKSYRIITFTLYVHFTESHIFL